jgi:glycerol-3-phosphate acyltransferase PlsY
MSTTLLVILTVIEIVALVAVLALFVIAITRRLRSLANAIGELSGTTIGAIQGDVFLVGAGAAILNRKLNAIAGALPAIAEKAESLPKQTQAQMPQQSQAHASGNAWRPAVAQDPVINR